LALLSWDNAGNKTLTKIQQVNYPVVWSTTYHPPHCHLPFNWSATFWPVTINRGFPPFQDGYPMTFPQSKVTLLLKLLASCQLIQYFTTQVFNYTT